MIVSNAPRIGHAAREVIAPLAVLFVWDVAVTVLFLRLHPNWSQLEVPLSLFGTALALFLGFRNNSAYARWWEARTLWGQVVNGSRSLARQVLTLSGAGGEAPALRRAAIRAQIAFVNHLRLALRDQSPDDPAVAAFLDAGRFAAVAGARNKPNAILVGIANLVAEAADKGLLDSMSRVRIETTLVDLTNAQGGMDRIKRTPMPSQYRIFASLFSHLFCVILPFAVVRDLGLYTPIGSTLVGLMFLVLLQGGEDLMDPFRNDIYDVPMSALCRTVEIDLLQMLGEAAPEPLAPENGVLW